MNATQLTSIIVIASGLALRAETVEQINKQFAVQPGGHLVVEVEVGSVDVTTNATGEVQVKAYRKVTRGSKEEEETYLRERPFTLTQDGNTVTIQCLAKPGSKWNWRGRQRLEVKYTITVPASFNARIKTSGGGIAVADLTGEVKGNTSGGGIKFARLHGPIEAHTSGGGITVLKSEGAMKVNTSGGGIEVTEGSGSLEGRTSGGSITVREFEGPVRVKTSGGGLKLDGIAGKVEGATSGGSITARIASVALDEVKLETSGGGVTLRVPENSTFELDAATSGGSVTSELPVTGSGKPSRRHLKGPVNGGGKPVLLRTSGGSIHVKKA